MSLGFPIRRELREKGFSEAAVRKLEQLSDFADAISRIADQEAAQAATDEAVNALQEQQEDQNVTLATLDTRIDHFENLEPFVRQDQTSAWVDATGTLSRATFATYTAPTISNPPTQAEVQAVANAVQTHSQRLAALVNDLRSNGALT